MLMKILTFGMLIQHRGMKYNTHSLFPTPVYISEINRPFTKKELNFVDNQKNKVNKNFNSFTKDTYILDKPELKSIKSFIDKNCKNYLDKIISPKHKVELYVTQSWINYMKQGEHHHPHAHPNSIVSGVFYLNADDKNDSIKFTHPKGYQQIKPEIDKYNIWNSDTWWLPVKTGQLIMFPSSLVHRVDTKKSHNTRISLAFNTFYRGILGSDNTLSELKV